MINQRSDDLTKSDKLATKRTHHSHHNTEPDFDDMIIRLHSRGLGICDISEHLKEFQKIELPHSRIYKTVNKIHSEINAWQSRELDPTYPIVYFDSITAQTGSKSRSFDRKIYLALAVKMNGQKEILGTWSSMHEDSKFWADRLTSLKNRGLQEIFMCCADGLNGFQKAIKTSYPDTHLQLCVVQMLRNSLKYTHSTESKLEVATALKTVYRAQTLNDAKLALKNFRREYDNRFPEIGKYWQENWKHLVPLFAYPPSVRQIIYTSKTIESLNHSFKEINRDRDFLLSSDAIHMLFYLAIRKTSTEWSTPIPNWPEARYRFTTAFQNNRQKKKGLKRHAFPRANNIQRTKKFTPSSPQIEIIDFAEKQPQSHEESASKEGNSYPEMSIGEYGIAIEAIANAHWTAQTALTDIAKIMRELPLSKNSTQEGSFIDPDSLAIEPDEYIALMDLIEHRLKNGTETDQA